MTQYGTWVTYSGNARLILAIILLVCAGGLVGAGILLRRPVGLPRPGSTLTVFMFAGWGAGGSRVPRLPRRLRPLVLVELTTLSLLTMSPMVRLSRTTFCCL